MIVYPPNFNFQNHKIISNYKQLQGIITMKIMIVIFLQPAQVLL